MKKKRTVVFGIPMYVVRKHVLPMALVCCALVVFYILISELSVDRITDFFIGRNLWVLILFTLLGFLPMISSIWLMIQIDRYTKRMKRLKGRACFVCNYEIGEGLERCSECGAEWSIDDLGRGWRKNFGMERG